MNAGTIERPAALSVETDITRALRAQQADVPAETRRLEERIVQLKAQRDPLAQAVQLLRVRVRAGLAKQMELDRAFSDLDQLDAEIRGVEVTLDELTSTQRVIAMELAEQLARQRVKVGTELTTEAKRAIAAISEGLAALQPHVDALLALRPVVAQFDRGVPHPHGYTVYHREVNAEVVRAVNFFTKDYHGGCDVAALRERWQAIANAVK
jgi:hypothetical protein